MIGPNGGYKNAKGKPVPRVTGILGKFKNPAGLMYWAWDQGRRGFDYRKTRDEAADAGKLAHKMVENVCNRRSQYDGIKGDEVDPESLHKAETAFGAYQRWFEDSRLTIINTELSLVSEEHQFGGTLDAVGLTPEGDLVLLDWKTSNGMYVEYIEQTAAYGIAYQEVCGARFERYDLLRFGKEHGDFNHKSLPLSAIEIGRESFLMKRKLYELNKQLSKLAK